MQIALREADVRALLDADSAAVLETHARSGDWQTAGAAFAAALSPAAAHARVPPLWDRLLAQFTEFLCSDSARYADLRAEWDALCRRSAALAVTALTTALAAELGVASTIAAPLVIWLVLSAVRMGTNVFCRR